MPKAIIIGGTVGQAGGVEAFIRRTIDGFPAEAGEVFWIHSNTAVLRGPSRWQPIVSLLGAAFRATVRILSDRPSMVVVHYGNALDLLFVFGASLISRKVWCVAHCSEGWAHLELNLLRPLVRHLIGKVPLLVLSQRQGEVFQQLRVTNIKNVPTVLGKFASSGAEEQSSRRTRSIVYAGRISAEKGVLDAVRVASLLSAPGQIWTLNVCGRVDEVFAQQLDECLITARRSGAIINILGPLDESALRKMLKEHRYFLYPSRQDAFPLALLEALSCGCIPLAYDLAGAEEITAKYGGCVVPAGDIPSLVALISAMELDEKARPVVQAERVRMDYRNSRFWEELTALAQNDPRLEPER